MHQFYIIIKKFPPEEKYALTDGMRISTSGSWGDCSFYTWSDYCENSGGPYLYVNRNTNMPSELSEEGHHTNPAQNQLIMNDEYKRMLAYLFYWSILKYHEIYLLYLQLLCLDCQYIQTIHHFLLFLVHLGDV